MKHSLVLFLLLFTFLPANLQKLPLVINTWGFTNAAVEAWNAVYHQNLSAIDSVVIGCSVCEREQCDGTVGYGGSPDENGETTLDAMIMDGKTMKMGAVAALRNVKDAIAVAKHVLLYTKHSMLVGNQASDFAEQQGFRKETLTTNVSKQIWSEWRANNCQPNYWQNVRPDPRTTCGPYKPNKIVKINSRDENSIFGYGKFNHDTIGMLVIDREGNIAAGTSTNGARHKIPGRVGDSPIPGAGSYADNEIGAAAATGDGDIMMRFLPSFLAVELMRQGRTPSDAGRLAIERIIKHYPEFMGGIIAADKYGNYGAACHGIDYFPFSVFNLESKDVQLIKIKCK
ncbi:N(4)-(Beta-N-acetylglucosaminyl)-L-asparaginase [Culicoides brevitarsis]|uniref:N(4)-(Beta-N-acetylglucosaminyl)-L-asparaginase n=1 Tax=Culicoides brevitarsis TaxID=469753 RepID=UPI00307C4E9D